MEDSFFRKLSPKEEKTFRDWVHNNIEEMKKHEASGNLQNLHPCVRDEWGKMRREAAEILA
jgi:hypothetical protein